MTQESNASDLQDFQARKDKYEQAIQKVERHIKMAQDGTVTLGVHTGPEIGVDPATFDELSKAVQQVNEYLKTGKLHRSQVLLTTTFGDTPATQMSVTAAGSCAGVDQLSTYWWGYKVRVNQCVTVEIEALLQEYQGGSALVAALTALFAGIPALQWLAGVALMATVTGAIAAIAQGAIQGEDQACGNQGIAFNFVWVSPWPWLTCS